MIELRLDEASEIHDQIVLQLDGYLAVISTLFAGPCDLSGVVLFGSALNQLLGLDLRLQSEFDLAIRRLLAWLRVQVAAGRLIVPAHEHVVPQDLRLL